MRRRSFFASATVLSVAVSAVLQVPATERKLKSDRYLVIDLTEILTEEIPAGEIIAEESSEEEISSEAYEQETFEEESSAESETYAETETEQEEIPFYLDLFKEEDTGFYSVETIMADEAIIGMILAQSEDYEGYDAVAVSEIISYQKDTELFDLNLQVTDGSEVIHYGIDDKETLCKAYPETVYSRLTGTTVSLSTETNHWLVVYLRAYEEMPFGEEGTGETEDDSEASSSLEGKVDESSETASASGTVTVSTKAPEKTTAQATTKAPAASTTAKAPETTKAPSTTAPTTAAPSKPVPTTAAPTTQAPTKPAPTTAAPTTEPPTTAHTHTWVPVTTTVHHDATYKQVWVEDQAAYDETVIDQAAYDEKVLVQEAWDENVLVRDAYDEPVYGWVGICNECGHAFQAGEDIGEHMEAGCWSSWHGEWLPVGTTHHDAVYQTVHHDAVYNTVHHDAVTHVVHHDAVGHYESVPDQAAWDETVITGYKCSGCGAVQ